ncbi:hypothetical protein [Actinoplanes subtropicus]|uniref:hypothetical protein n=1 Tax=Actinoplanes subtropicus TaxID=543632 RepID=UPI0012F8F299|nr:hypothetical protein [Actinoplanes subtropicus]
MRRRWLGICWLGTMICAPLVLGGCKASSVASPVPSPSGTPWVITVSGSATPSPSPSVATATPSTFPTGFLPLPSGSVTPTPTGSATDCPPDASHDIGGATVVPGTTSAAVTFYNPGGSYLVEYRITAISQDVLVGQQRDVGWTVVTPGTGCGYLTATVSGLDAKTRYVFSVDAVTTMLGRDGTQASTVARSGVVTTA